MSSWVFPPDVPRVKEEAGGGFQKLAHASRAALN